MSDETCVSCNEPIKAGLVKAGDLPLHFKCTVPCVECQTALTSVTVRVSKDREYFCATHFPLQFLKKCATCGHRLREDEPSVKIDIKFHHASCLPQPPPPPPKEPEPEPVPEPEPAPVPEPVETGNTIGAVFHLQREEINKEIGLKWMIHDIELSDFEAEVLLRGSGAPGSFLVYYTANGRARDYNLLFWAEADDIQNISILDNNFKYQLYGHDQKFGFIGDLITHYQSNPVYKGKQLGSPCNFPEQYADPTEEDKRSPFINEIVAIRGELALMQHLYEDALKLKSDWVNKKDRAEQLADLDYTIAATEQRVELCKALTAKPAETAFGNDKFADPELLESAVSAYKAAHVAEEEMPDDDTISITSELEDIDEAEVPIAPELNSLDATLRRFYKENELVDANGHVTAANLATLVVQALPMRQKKLVERRIKKRKDIQAAFKKDELGVSHLLSLVREFFIFPKLMAVFTENAKTNTDFMTILEFKAYLKREPHLAADSENIVALFYKLADQNKKSKAQDPELAAARDMFGAHVAVTQDGFMTSLGFVQFMFTTGCAAFNPVHRKVYQDMNQPLAHYFINTGHNSYLEADQLMGPSSTDAYRKALLAGCRCVEIDLWDGPKGEPIVYHGYTMTSKIAARNVLLAIKESAFEASPYPVILSLENHLCLEQQTLFVKYCVDIFGDQLIVAASNFWESNPKELPPPESLKRKIIIKNKAHPNRGGVNPNDPSSVKAAKVISQEMSDAVVYCKSVRYATMRKATETTKCYEMSSFAEKRLQARPRRVDATSSHAGHLVRVTRRKRLIRPTTTRSRCGMSASRWLL
ncbi:phospholipase C [Capsaspora owczarzaki ATCC 30864]|uniref:Phosphoinositide phospholipase C n=1 Tax=Capsaspora owczarzaki (strain ATCC 30864) TaxID=595528 RepID=A0A0D2W0W7_CAPO3|nr:phospholipase C [Capsaspora owczarzaki ATCC 30864]KJE97897.1 phospholipase C [Capsaspora owczarzaki ATCC 30864]|eukprot:XP_004343063.2 phospholipase C [Capsaspora owczarzaki ATCC 30864]